MSAKQGKGKGNEHREGRNAAGQKQARLRNRGKEQAADWSSADASLVGRVVSAITKHKFTVQFGYTLDGGQYQIRVYGDGDAYNEYLPATGDIDLWLTGFCEDYELDGTRPEYDGAVST